MIGNYYEVNIIYTRDIIQVYNQIIYNNNKQTKNYELTCAPATEYYVQYPIFHSGWTSQVETKHIYYLHTNYQIILTQLALPI